MAVTHTLSFSYSGGLPSPFGGTFEKTGDNGLAIDEDCAASGTTTVSNPIIFDPDAKVQAMALLVTGGDATFTWDGSGTDVTIALTDGQPIVRSNPEFGLAGVPTSSDTYTLKITCGSDSVNFKGVILMND